MTKERPVLSKRTKNIVATFHLWNEIVESEHLISFRSFRQNVYVLWVLYITLTFLFFLLISLLISSTLFTITKYIISKWKNRVLLFYWRVIFSTAKRHKRNSVGNMDETLHGRKINAEFSLQSASQNSRENNQRQSWSQIREFWAKFVIGCYWIRYTYVLSFSSLFYPFLAAEALR